MLSETELRRLLLEGTGLRRYTQDSPIFADVWLGYFPDDKPRPERQDLLLEPHFRVTAGQLAKVVRDRLDLTGEHRLAYAGEYVAVELTLKELLGWVLPLSSWWKDLIRPLEGSVFARLEEFATGGPLIPKDKKRKAVEVPPPEHELAWLLRVAGRTLTDTSDKEADARGFGDLRKLTKAMLDELVGHPDDKPADVQPLWSVSLNRELTTTLWRSRETVKADAASRVFPSDTEGLAWAVIDSGIDAKHPAFRTRDADGKLAALPKGDFDSVTTVRATFQFTDLRDKVAEAIAAGADAAANATAMQEALANGLAIDWRLYQELIEVQHDGNYPVPGPADAHGTHVAGTIAGDWRMDDDDGPRRSLEGICPGLTLYDLRVLKDGRGSEFGVLAALSFIRWRNTQSGGTVIHGVNMSLALEHNVLNSACGRSPVCLEAERVHNAGVVVVAAAGNDGRAMYKNQNGDEREGYRTVSISDPGNADVVITVGSTHRLEPHAYGVSYFSSRGPTGDGRAKPDIVAPGEKITAPTPDEGSARMDGTSMAAPHVSGAAAVLMARHRELVGQPARIKQVLCDSATDLGREHHYQGHGLLDILRALQAV
jgi:serine protease AprX